MMASRAFSRFRCLSTNLTIDVTRKPKLISIQRLSTSKLCTVGGQGHANPLMEDDYFGVKKLVSLKDLFDARVHLGHQEGVWEQKMKPFIYGTRAHHHIIDLDITLRNLQLALNVVSHVAYRGGIILFLSTYPRYEHLIQKTAREANEFFVTRSWSPGTFTNKDKLFPHHKVRTPDLIIFMNLTFLGNSQSAVIEAAMANIPSIGIVDTDCDPTHITYPVPGNDDTPCAMELYCHLFKEAILVAKSRRESDAEKLGNKKHNLNLSRAVTW